MRHAELWRDETVRRHELPGLLERTMNAIAYQAKAVDLGPRWDTALGRSEGGSKRWGATPKTTPAPKPKREPATRADTADSEAERAAAERRGASAHPGREAHDRDGGGMKYIVGDCRVVLATLPAASVQCCVTSPPYYGLRDYGVAGQIGLEPTPDEYVAEMVAVFREVRRVLREDGTLWLNIGDSYAAGGMGPGSGKQLTNVGAAMPPKRAPEGTKPKDLLGIPWLLAFALRADGWYLRSDIIWHKPNPMPESVRDRPTSAHEHVFLLSKRAAYFYDAGAIAEPIEYAAEVRVATPKNIAMGKAPTREYGHPTGSDTRNARNVWTIAPQPFSGAHFATMPPALAERCIKAGTRLGDAVLDPFGGAGTTAVAADRLGRRSIMIDLSQDYAVLAEKRLLDDRMKRVPAAFRGML